MNLTRTLVAVLASFVSLTTAASAASSTLSYTNRSDDAARMLTLRRDGNRVVIVDDRSRTVVASASAAETQRVVVQGAPGKHDDTLTLDLSNPISLPGGIDYDGGADGWDTLVVTGGHTQHESVTQLTPHDGVFDLDGLVLRYTNLEPLTDLGAAASMTVTGSAGADTVTIADGPGAGQATISSPTFESVTFANKTNVTFDGGGGTDTVLFNNPNTPTSLVSFIVQSVSTIAQIAPIHYSKFGASTTGAVTLSNSGNDVDNVEILTQTGNIRFTDANAATIGGVSASLSGLRAVTNGGITFITSGIMTLADTDGGEIIHAGATGGDVFLQAFGIGSDIKTTVNNKAINANFGSVTVVSGGDILLGTFGADFANDVTASGPVSLTALRDVNISGTTHVFSDNFGTSSGGNASATAGRDFLLSNATGMGATFGSNGTAGADTAIMATTGSVNLSAPSANALFSTSGDVTVTTNRLIIAATSGITASSGSVTISSATVPVDFGSTTDVAAALELSDAESDRITTPILSVESGTGQNLTVTQPITFSGQLSLLSDSTFSASGSGSLTAPTLTFADLGSAARTWTINGTSITITPGAAIPYSGVTTLDVNGASGSDTFNVTPALSTAMAINGQLPVPPALPGDTLHVDTTGTTSPLLTYMLTGAGYAGSYTFGNRSRVDFSNIETLDATTDLGVTKTDGTAAATPGSTVTYTIVASNPGSLGVAGATVVDTFPVGLSNISWTCIASAGSACNPGGGGGLNQLVNLAAGGTATFTVTATINPGATGSLTNSVTIAPPAGVTDPNLNNNTATDTDTLAAIAQVATLSAGALLLLAVTLGLTAFATFRRI